MLPGIMVIVLGFFIAFGGTLIPKYKIYEDAPCERNTGAIAWIQCYPVSILGFIVAVFGLVMFLF